MYKNYIKRLLDILVSGLGLILLSPLLLIVALLVRIKLGSPVIFRQKRPGKNEKIFTLCKFRTMTDARNEKGELLSDTVRLTPFGKLLRSTSLDELPELWNIFKGDMSLIGPRPLLVSYLPFYTKEERRRHSVRPGLTGLAQIRGRSALNWEERFAYDLEYVDGCSLKMDIMIFVETISKVFSRSGTLGGEAQSLPDFDEYRNRKRG